MSHTATQRVLTAEPNTLGRVALFRQAARLVLRSGLDGEERARGLTNLVRRGRGEKFGETICRAILSEVIWSIEFPDLRARQSIGDVMEAAARKLRADGRRECPTCRTPLSGPVDWDYWRTLREAAISEAEAREQAVA